MPNGEFRGILFVRDDEETVFEVDARYPTGSRAGTACQADFAPQLWGHRSFSLVDRNGIEIGRFSLGW
ncbi:MAG TPA: hypothetical protein DEP84_20855 [Chloroflexi bacterium]|nr:hypothetical protein [Chloroflexota bacterium]